MTRLRRAIRDERGVVLPMAMLVLVSLSALMMAFIALAQTEPTIAANHSHAAQARALAESGVTRAMWALSNPTAPGGLSETPESALSPYNGGTFFSMGSIGGFTVQVTAGATSLERTITAVGWTPNNNDTHNTHRKVQVTIQKPPRPLDPPAALSVSGQLQVGGNATIDSRNNGCGTLPPPVTGTISTGPTIRQGSANIYGYGDNTPNGLTDYAQSTGTSAPFTYTQAELDQLKSIAQANGTYYRGAVSTLPAAGGVIFIDTTDGSNYSSSTPDANAGSLTLSGNGTYNGIVIVAGTATISGNVTFNGLLYSLNDMTLSGNATINGAVVTENRKDTSSTNVDSLATGAVTIAFNCQNVRTGGGTTNLGSTWTVKNGTWLEVAGN